MGDSIERALEETVPILRAAQRAKLLSAEETSDVVRRRRDHEYAVAARGATRSEFLKYAAFERELASVLSKRAEKRKLKKQKAQLVIGKSAARVNLVYSRAVKKFHGDADLWLHYARHCVRTGSTKAAGKVFAKALGHRGDSEEVWLAAVAFHFDTCSDARGARALAQRALRALPDSITMWKEYFRLEVCYLAKLISRRIAMGLPVSGAEDNLATAADAKHGEEQSSEPGNDEDDDDDDDDEADFEMRNANDEVDSDSVQNGHAEGAGQTSTPLNEKMSFWDGGVPMAVYNNACKKVVFTARDRADFWDIVAATPYAPIQLLKSLSNSMVNDCPDCTVSRLIQLRLDWDLAHSRYREELARLAEKTESERGENEILPGNLKESSQELAKQALHVVSRMKETLAEAPTESLVEASRNAVLTCIESFIALAKAFDQSGATLDQTRQLLAQLKSGKVTRATSYLGDRAAQEGDKTGDPTTWSVEHLADMLVAKKCPLSRQVFDILKAKVVVPFRKSNQEKALCAWISAESNLKRLHEICDALLSMPPLTSESLRSAIRSQAKIQERMRKQEKLSTEDSEQLISQTRKLFKAAVSLPTASTDIDLWLDYVDFERRIARDPKQASFASWKAMKALDQSRGELFTERQTLRNMVL